MPILINTSFNENEPIVNTPAQAIDCFLRTNMDVPGDRIVPASGSRRDGTARDARNDVVGAERRRS